MARRYQATVRSVSTEADTNPAKPPRSSHHRRSQSRTPDPPLKSAMRQVREPRKPTPNPSPERQGRGENAHSANLKHASSKKSKRKSSPHPRFADQQKPAEDTKRPHSKRASSRKRADKTAAEVSNGQSKNMSDPSLQVVGIDAPHWAKKVFTSCDTVTPLVPLGPLSDLVPPPSTS